MTDHNNRPRPLPFDLDAEALKEARAELKASERSERAYSLASAQLLALMCGGVLYGAVERSWPSGAWGIPGIVWVSAALFVLAVAAMMRGLFVTKNTARLRLEIIHREDAMTHKNETPYAMRKTSHAVARNEEGFPPS